MLSNVNTSWITPNKRKTSEGISQHSGTAVVVYQNDIMGRMSFVLTNRLPVNLEHKGSKYVLKTQGY